MGTAGPLQLCGAPLQTPWEALSPVLLRGSSAGHAGPPAWQEEWTGRAWCSGPAHTFPTSPEVWRAQVLARRLKPQEASAQGNPPFPPSYPSPSPPTSPKGLLVRD